LITESLRLNKNLDEIDWRRLSTNTNAMSILAPLDYSTMKATWKPFCKELVEYVLHPLRIGRISLNHGLDVEEYLEQVF
jgi:hypothetical protein